MQIISRAQLLATLTGPLFDPDSTFIVEMSAFANAILAHAPASVTHFVYTDHENGDDAEVIWPVYLKPRTVQLLDFRKCSSDNGYYGLVAQQHQHSLPDDSRWLYQCFLGGCPVQSAPGFVISTAIMLP